MPSAAMYVVASDNNHGIQTGYKAWVGQTQLFEHMFRHYFFLDCIDERGARQKFKAMAAVFARFYAAGVT